MRLPDTQNANQLYAFKKGYRLAIDGKTINQAPSNIRYDQSMRQYCLMGWDQAQEEMAAGLEASQKKPWRNRLAWFLVTILGGIATSTVLINNINEKKAQQQALINKAGSAQLTQSRQTEASAQTMQLPQTSKLVQADKTVEKSEVTAVNINRDVSSPAFEMTGNPESEPHKGALKPEEDLALLTPQQREDLRLTQQERQNALPAVIAMAPVVNTTGISVETPALTSNVVDKQPTELFTLRVPKNIRKLYFFTQIKGAEGKVIYHRWLHNQQVMALIPLTINSNLYRTWSSKRLTSAWQGQWTVEVLDAEKQVLYRQAFTYGNL